MALFGSIWRYVMLCDVMGCQVPLCGIMWRLWLYVALGGVMWRYVALCGVRWCYVALCGAM